MCFEKGTRNIISISVLCKIGHNVQLNGNECFIFLENVLVGKAINANGLYVLELKEFEVKQTLRFYGIID